MKADAVIVAAGGSTRFGGDKLFADLCGRPVLGWTLQAFRDCGTTGALIVVTTPANIHRVTALTAEWPPDSRVAVVLGGARRRDSVAAGLRASSSRYVAIHDGARPLVTPALIDRVIQAAEGRVGAIPALPVTETIKAVADGVVREHLDRSWLQAAQTPQVVLRQAWLDAAAAGDDDETDDAAMLGRLGLEVAVVEGDPANIKISRPGDLLIAAAILRERLP